MINIQSLSSAQLRKVIVLKEKIEELEAELASLFGSPTAVAEAPVKAKAGRRTMSAAAKERIAAAQRARWAKVHAAAGKTASTAPAKAPAKKRQLSPAARAKLAAIAKARWAKVKASGKSTL